MKTYIKFVNSIYKDMNMKDLSFTDKEWFLELFSWGVTLTRLGKDFERLHIPWNNIVVIQRF